MVRKLAEIAFRSRFAFARSIRLLVLCSVWGDGSAGSLVHAVEPAKVAIDLNRPFSGYALCDAFPGLTFDQPICLAFPPGETNRLFIAERAGSIWVITNLAAPNKTLFLDLRSQTYSDYVEAGLLGFAFHPRFETNGMFFVYRSVATPSLNQRLSRFQTRTDNPKQADNTETILIKHDDRSPTHNGGDLHFGPDGYLYFSVGDESPMSVDQRALPIAIDGGLFGGIFRIDVDQKPGNPPPNAHPSVIGNYSIPADNPFVGATSFLGQAVDPARVRSEFYAVGFRNPWRFTIDGLTGEIIAGDVGGTWAEEINLVKKGANYGWPYWEGEYVHELSLPDGMVSEPPLISLLHGWAPDQAFCIIGGVVCRNTSIPDMEGWYVFGDERSGNIWRMHTDNPKDRRWLARDEGTVAFGVDPSTGDLLTVNFQRGQIRRLIFVAPEEERVPLKLSSVGAFSEFSPLTPAAGLVPYEVNVPFWSDHALKKRWIGMMDGSAKIGFKPTNNWNFPHGTVLVKHFDLPMEDGKADSIRKIETRLLVKSGEEFFGFSYRWAASGTDADLVPAIGLDEPLEIKIADWQVRTQVWKFPSRGDCAACHSKVGGGVLGCTTPQMNVDEGGGNDQLARLAQAGYFDTTNIDSKNLPRFVAATNTAEPLEWRVKSYLAANCSQCHQPGGIWATQWNANWASAMADSQIVHGMSYEPLNDESQIIIPGNLTNSMLRLHITDPSIRMPPLGSSVLDNGADALLSEWILSLPGPAFAEVEIGEGALHGSVSQFGDVRRVSGIGKGVSNSGDRLHMLTGTLKRAGQVIARMNTATAAEGGLAGLMVRNAASPTAAALWLTHDSSGQNRFVRRVGDGVGVMETASMSQWNQPWLRIMRDGNHFEAFEGSDGVTWSKIGEGDFAMGDTVLAGIGVSSGEDWRYGTAEFDALQTVSVALQVKDSRPGSPLPHDLILTATAETNGVALLRVDFVADGQVIGSRETAPYRMLWTNAWAGKYDVRAVAVDQNRNTVSSEATIVSLEGSPPIARYLNSNAADANWQSNFGAIGRSIPAVNTVLPTRVSVDVSDADAQTYTGPGVLPTVEGTLPATAWASDEGMSVEYRPGNEVPHTLTLFFAQYENADTVDVSFFDSSTGALLDSQTVTGYENGLFVSWAVRGNVNLWIQSSSGLNATLNGIFIDALPAPTVTLLPVPSPVELPASILLQADAAAEGRGIQRVEFWDEDVLLGEVDAAPYQFSWTKPLLGDHQITALAVGEFGLQARSAPITITCEEPSASAMFLGEDTKTRGDWIGTYGEVGQLMVLGRTNLPPELSLSVTGSVFGFAYSDPDPGLLLRSVDNLNDRFGGCYFMDFNLPVALRVTTRDGAPRQMALYFLDFMGPGRSEKITVFDALTGIVLDTRTIDLFYDGAYLVWNIVGDVRVEISSLNDFNSIVNAVFFDSPEAPSSFWFHQKFPGISPTSAKWLEDPDNDGRPNFAEYSLGTDPFEADPPLIIQAAAQSGGVSLKVPTTGTVDGDRVSVECSTDLVHWMDESMKREISDGYILFTSETSETGPFYRLRIESPMP